jgi:hypothetical protein
MPLLWPRLLIIVMQGICLRAYPTSAQKNILLSAKGVLLPPKLQVDTGRGERSKTSLGQAQSAVLNETSKKNVKRQHSVAVA